MHAPPACIARSYGTLFALGKYEVCFVFWKSPKVRTGTPRRAAMSISPSFDLLLRGGRVIDPASGIDGIKDVAIRNGKIAAVQSDILPTSAKEVIDVTGQLVLPGLIDTHAHVYQYVSGRFGMNPDMVGVQSGVTTLIDQGGPSCMTLPGFRHFIAEPAKSRVYAFLRAAHRRAAEDQHRPDAGEGDHHDLHAVAEAERDQRDRKQRDGRDRPQRFDGDFHQPVERSENADHPQAQLFLAQLYDLGEAGL
eukprot:gene7746-10464_t